MPFNNIHFDFPVTFTTAGSHLLVAYYLGDTAYAPAQSAPNTIQAVATSVKLNTSGPLGLVFSVSATVSGAGGCQGNVSLLESGKVLATMTLPDSFNADGSVSVSFSTNGNPPVAIGPHTLIASFTTTNTFCGPGTSPPLSVYTGYPTSTTQITSVTPNPSTFGQTPQASVKVLPGIGAATGQVSLVLAGSGTGLGSGTLDPTGSISFTVPSLPVGSWDIIAKYQGSPTVQASDSAPFKVVVQPALTFVSSASSQGIIAPDSLATVYGPNLTGVSAQASGLPLPTTLGGVQISVVLQTGENVNVPLLFASPGQVNFLVPAAAKTGQVIVSLTTNGKLLSGQAIVGAVAPAIFTADGSGSGVPIGILYTAHADGTQVSQPIYSCNSSGCQPVPVDVSNPTDTNVLVLYATGIRNALLPSITAQLGSVNPSVLFAGAQSQFPGLDQINLQLPGSLAGSGQVMLQIVASGQKANPVRLMFR
jgi:uncharacterized protein (TIGR03437 family)